MIRRKTGFTTEEQVRDRSYKKWQSKAMWEGRWIDYIDVDLNAAIAAAERQLTQTRQEGKGVKPPNQTGNMM